MRTCNEGLTSEIIKANRWKQDSRSSQEDALPAANLLPAYGALREPRVEGALAAQRDVPAGLQHHLQWAVKTHLFGEDYFFVCFLARVRSESVGIRARCRG